MYQGFFLDIFLHWEAVLIKFFNLILIALRWLVVGKGAEISCLLLFEILFAFGDIWGLEVLVLASFFFVN